MIPKFRAFDVETKQMKEVMFLDLLRKTAWFDTDEEAIGYDFETCKLMQSTGLDDKNGKEIFEGDTVKYWGNIGYIEFYQGSWVINWNDGSLFDLYGSEIHLEIIGNVHEHSELLKTEEETK